MRYYSQRKKRKPYDTTRYYRASKLYQAMRMTQVAQLNATYISHMSNIRDPIKLMYTLFEFHEKQLEILQSRGPYQLYKCLTVHVSSRRNGKSTMFKELSRFGWGWKIGEE